MATKHIQAWTVVIDQWHPTPLNRLLSCHWATRAKRKRIDYKVIADYCGFCGVTTATGRRRVYLSLIMAPKQRSPDPDSLWKVVLDGLVKCGALRNDSHLWCELMPVLFLRGATKQTRIGIEDI